MSCPFVFRVDCTINTSLLSPMVLFAHGRANFESDTGRCVLITGWAPSASKIKFHWMRREPAEEFQIWKFSWHSGSPTRWLPDRAQCNSILGLSPPATSTPNVVPNSNANIVCVGCDLIDSGKDNISGFQSQGSCPNSLAEANSYPAFQVVGVILAIASGVLIGSSFVFKKKGLLRSQAGGELGEGVAYLKSVGVTRMTFQKEGHL